ncbi:efflux RND transporter permease subunit [Bacillus sp. Xin]|uniref:efflux RND transporter permease subunit n=1 Tax=unclassified Bacillus (in: firmicutes) TaxID=185979 RepID=UPI001572D1E4|nr:MULTISPECIES: efflux RND transporter permease subunit [unclassified Bacillus (in: firmicutes)]MBC6973732.1 efflux RND transporter permease subunit [Bacillus sp. Xin]NSW35955.1 efflux RND transporter permease subunit [Bacillus sp. Xin1]
MDRLTKFSLKNRAAIIIMVFLISVLGIYSGSKLPMEFLPSVDNPAITVTTLSQGLDAETLTKEVTEPLEKKFRNLEHVDTITSSTYEGLSRIDIAYNSKVNMKDAAREVEKITNNMAFQKEITKPVVSQLNTSMIPLAQITVQKQNGFTKADEKQIEKEIIPQLENIDGVANVIYFGKSTSELSITLDTEQMKNKNITPQQVLTALQGKETSTPVGQVTVNNKEHTLRIIGNVKNINEVKNMTLAPQVKLQDIAQVEAKQHYDTISHINGEDGTALIIMKEPSKNAVEIGKEIDKRVKNISKEYKDTYTIKVLSSTHEQVENAVMSMGQEVILGAIAATFIILIFLRSVRTTLIAVVSIPLSILLTLFLLDQSNVTLNILTLGGLAVAVGRLVDDSIVVIENIFRRLQKDHFSKDIILDATKEVAVAITSSTLTTVAVFLPIGLVSGTIGELMLPMVLAVVYSILSSLVIALTVVPLMAFLLLKKTKQRSPKPSRKYIATLKWALSHKFIILFSSFLLFAGSIAAYILLPKANIKSEDDTMLSIEMTFPTNYDLESTKQTAFDFEKKLLSNNDVKDIILRMGSSAEDAQWGQTMKSNLASIFVVFKKGTDIDQYIKKIKKEQADFKPAEFDYIKTSYSSFGGGNNLQFNVTANNETNLKKAANIVESKLKSIDSLSKVKTNLEESKQEWQIHIDQAKAEQIGLTPETAGQQVSFLMKKSPIGQLTIDDEKTTIMLEHKKEQINKKEDVLNTNILSPITGPIPLKDIATISEKQLQTEIFHKDGKETIQISAQATNDDLSKVSAEVNKAISELDLPTGAKVNVAGATESMQENFTDLFKIMGIAIGIVYLIMVITFGQARAPFAILFSLPLAAVGGILGLIISRTPVDLNALIGALMLIGIVVTNAIVLIERVQQNREQGMTTREALLEAGSTRLRPIIMTAITTIVAMLPLLFGQSQSGSMVSKSLAVVVIGGLAVSTVLTLVVVPVMYELLDKFGKKRSSRRKIDSSIDTPKA